MRIKPNELEPGDYIVGVGYVKSVLPGSPLQYASVLLEDGEDPNCPAMVHFRPERELEVIR